MRFNRVFILCITAVSILCACAGGGGGGSSTNTGSQSADYGCDGFCAHQALSTAEVQQIVSQFDSAAQFLGVSGTIAVLDRVGNVLAVYAMSGANASTTVNGFIGANSGLEGSTFPSALAAISKAGTGAFLSSQGNAFSSRTASQIVQENFNPGEERQPGGPLFGVQFSQLPCSDLNGSGLGPRPLPLGLSADPGGIPLYKLGDMVGGVGVELDGVYGLDRDVLDQDDSIEERLALYASQGFEAPSERTGNNINALGKTLRFTDLSYSDLAPLPEIAYAPSGSYVALAGFSSAAARGGATYGGAESGILSSSRLGIPASYLVGAGGAPRYPSRSGSSLGGLELSAGEVEAILDAAFLTAYKTRAAIRTPRDSQAHVSIFVVDHLGTPLGMIRTADGPVFGNDVALQKARTAVFFSSADAGARLNAAGFGAYVQASAVFLGRDILAEGLAITCRAVGNLSRPFFTDGLQGNPNGPLSLPFPGSAAGRTWSPFNTGLQFDLVAARLGASGSCTDTGAFGRRLANGIQIFPGSVPLYRGSTLIGAIGISGDGVDQDDMIAFGGASRAGLDGAGHAEIGDPTFGFNAPFELRSDNVQGPFENTRLRYVNCPESPFREGDDQNICEN